MKPPNKILVALFMLRPSMIARFIGANHMAQKARALVLHDQILTDHPRPWRK